MRDVASRVVFMDGGRIQEQGAPKELLNQPKSERLAAFLGRFHVASQRHAPVGAKANGLV